jgi:SAM-dependent methyltransferase
MDASEIIDFYKRRHDSYDDNQAGSNNRMANFLLRHCAERQFRILNIGAATRLPLEVLLQQATSRLHKDVREMMAGLALVSVDTTMRNSRRNVHQLRTNLAQRQGQTFSFEAVATDMQSLAFADKSFDVVVSNLALDILPEPSRSQSFEEAKRVLRPSGILYAHLHSADMVKPVGHNSGFWMDHYMDTSETVQAYVESFGFSGVTVEAISDSRATLTDYFTLQASK